MGFYSSLVFYRPGPPPPITAAALSRFVRRVMDSGLVTTDSSTSYGVKFGSSIWQDWLPSDWIEPLIPGMGVCKQIEWDLAGPETRDIAGIVSELADDNRRVYRSHIFIGKPIKRVRDPLTRQHSDQDPTGLYPQALTLSVDRIEIVGPASTKCWHVGWVALSIGGDGSFYPWTLPDVVARIQQLPEIVELCEICRSTWPVPSVQPSWLDVRRRRKHQDLWPYDDVKKPRDWYWGVQC